MKKVKQSGNDMGMALMKSFLQGFGSVLEISPQPRRYHVELHGSRVDYQRLRGDFLHIGRDMTNVMQPDDLVEKPSTKMARSVVVRDSHAQTMRKHSRRGIQRG